MWLAAPYVRASRCWAPLWARPSGAALWLAEQAGCLTVIGEDPDL